MYVSSQLCWGNHWLTAQLAERIATLTECIFHSAPFYSSFNLWPATTPSTTTAMGSALQWPALSHDRERKRKNPRSEAKTSKSTWRAHCKCGTPWGRVEGLGLTKMKLKLKRELQLEVETALESYKSECGEAQAGSGWVCYACVVISIKAAQLSSLQREQQRKHNNNCCKYLGSTCNERQFSAKKYL